MRRSGTSILGLLAIVFIIFEGVPFCAAKLIASWSFDGNVITANSGICPFPPYLSNPVQAGGGTLTFVTSKPGFGQALQVDGSNNKPYVNAGAWSISPTSNAYTIAAFVNVASSGNTQSAHWVISKYTSGGSTRYSWALGVLEESASMIGFIFRGGYSSSNYYYVATSKSYAKNTWYHLAGVFNSGGRLRLYVNGFEVGSTNLNGMSVYEDGAQVNIGGGNTGGYSAFVDEARIYDTALSASEIQLLANLTGTQTPPVVNMPPAQTVSVGTPAQLSASATSVRTITYAWSLLGGCVYGDFAPPTSPITNATIINGVVFQTYTVELQANDGLYCKTGTVQITLDASLPGYDPGASTWPSNGILNVPEGSTADVNIVLTGQPLPMIRFQELVDITSRRELVFRHGLDEPDEIKEMRTAAVLALCNETANFTDQCSAWLDIPNATFARYTTPRGDAFLNHTLIRFTASNSRGLFVSSPVEIVVGVRTSGDGGDGGDGTDVGVIVGPVVGGVGACLCLCFLCLLLIVILLLLRRRIITSNEFPGIPPDYEAVIFGPYLESMYKVKSKNEGALQKLETLLTSDRDYLLALAISRSASKSYEESLARNFVYLYASHHQTQQVLEAFIASQIDATQDPSTMFRANTIDSKMFKHFSVLVAAPYLWEILAPFVWEIQQDARAIDDPEDDLEKGSSSSSMSMSSISKKSSRTRAIGMEIDPTKMDEAADPKVNTLQLWLTAQKIFSAITRSTREMPKELADVLVYVHDTTAAKFSGEEYKAMGGFLFLRYICPSLVAPHTYGLIEEPPSPTAQRQLILVGKVLQNLSNNTLPGTKEDYMQRLNEFITNNQAELTGFYDEILRAGNSLPSANRDVPTIVKKNALADIYNIMLSNKNALYNELGEYYGQGDAIFNELDAIFSGGAIAENH